MQAGRPQALVETALIVATFPFDTVSYEPLRYMSSVALAFDGCSVPGGRASNTASAMGHARSLVTCTPNPEAASAPQRRQWKQSMLMIQGVRGTTKASAFSVEFVIYVGTQCSRLAGQIRDALQLRVWDAPALAHNKYVLHALRDELFLFASWSSRLVCDRASRFSSRPPPSPCTYPLSFARTTSAHSPPPQCTL